MKKTIILAAIACVALASCVKNEVVETSPTGNLEISFNPLARPNTKALITSATYPTDHLFNVWSVFSADDLTFANLGTGADFIGATGGAGAPFANAGTTYWAGYGTTYYWPRAGKLSFVAFSPNTVASAYTWSTKTFAVNDYTINQANDLMYSDITPNKTRNDYSSGFPYDDNGSGDTGFDDYKGVNILFHHSQSLVQFKVLKENTASNETITVTGITLDNAYTTGDLTVTYTDFNAASAGWNDYADEINVTFMSGVSQVVTTTAANLPATAGTGADLIVLPQSLNHTATSKDVQVAITFTSTVGSVTSPATTLRITLSDATSPTGHNAWEPNKRYIYTIKFVGTEIILDPKVVDYDTAVDVTLPDLAAY